MILLRLVLSIFILALGAMLAFSVSAGLVFPAGMLCVVIAALVIVNIASGD